MKYLYIGLMALTLLGCFAKQKEQPRQFTCITAFGPTQLVVGEEGVRQSGAFIIIEREDATFYIYKSMCVETVLK